MTFAVKTVTSSYSSLDSCKSRDFSTFRKETRFSAWTPCRLLPIVLLLLSMLAHAKAEIHAPCLGCRLFNLEHRHHPENKQSNRFCHYPCQCPLEELICHEGVNDIKDGCGCCYMCARQLGDMCSIKDLCDSKKGLFCDSKGENYTGTCRGKDKNPCVVGNVTYEDGAKFQPECSQLCTCQNGFYGCVNTCPQESQKPSELTCHEPKLMEAKGKCCKEWRCQKMEASGSSLLAGVRGLESQNLVIQNPKWYQTSTQPPPPPPTTEDPNLVRPCDVRETVWSHCSATCGVGVSIKMVVDPVSCHHVQQTRICYLRPCGMNLTTMGRDKCTPTTRSKHRHHIKFQDCLSVRDYSLKFCTNCRKNRCCYPAKVVPKTIEFQCSGGQTETMNYMWIKKCRCDRSCYKRDRGRRQGRGQGRKERKERRRERKRLRRRRRRRWRRFHM